MSRTSEKRTKIVNSVPGGERLRRLPHVREHRLASRLCQCVHDVGGNRCSLYVVTNSSMIRREDIPSGLSCDLPRQTSLMSVSHQIVATWQQLHCRPSRKTKRTLPVHGLPIPRSPHSWSLPHCEGSLYRGLIITLNIHLVLDLVIARIAQMFAVGPRRCFLTSRTTIGSNHAKNVPRCLHHMIQIVRFNLFHERIA